MDLSSFFPPIDVVFDRRSGGDEPCQRRTMTAAVAVSEVIPMSDIVPRSRSDALSRVHAQSSAETSGLGDSLQRIHALSSTETGFPSPTGGGQVSAYASMEDVPAGAGHAAGAAMRSPPQPPPVWVVEKERTGRGGLSYAAGDPTAGGGGGRGRPAGCERDASPPPGHATEDHYEDCYDDHKWQQIHRERALLQSASNAFHSDNSRRAKETENKDHQRFEKRGSIGSEEMSTSPTANQQGTTEAGAGAGGHFLGKSTQSAWLRWSHERRASFKRKVEFIEQRQNELQRIRTSSPVRKARKESMRFVSPELEDQHMSFNDDVTTLAHPAFSFEIPPTAAKKPSRKGNNEDKDDARLTLAQWNALVAFWEHGVFVRSRCLGFLLGLIAFCLIISGLSTSHWFSTDGKRSMDQIANQLLIDYCLNLI